MFNFCNTIQSIYLIGSYTNLLYDLRICLLRWYTTR